MNKYHKVKVAEIRRETPDCVSVLFDIPHNLHDKFTFVAGQHVIVRKSIGGEDVRRTYSFCSAPKSGEYRIAVRQVEGGLFSTFINQALQVGDELEISEPTGEFTLKTDPSHANNYVAFAAGSGITPIISMIKDVLTQEPNSKFLLYYSNKDAEHTIFANDIADLKNQYMDRLSYQLILTREDKEEASKLNSRLDSEKSKGLHAQVFAPLGIDGYYLCGPLAMINNLRTALIHAGEPEAHIHSELFFAPAKGTVQAKQSQQVKPAAMESQITLITDGQEVVVNYSDAHGSILEATLKSGIDASFSCKGGVCATCRAKVVAGEVDMKLNYGLEPEEIADGFVLTCQSVPLTENVTLSYDE